MRISDWSSDVSSSDLNLRHLLKLDDTSGAAARKGAKGRASKAAEEAAEAKAREAAAGKAARSADDEEVFIVVAQIGTYCMGIIVDRVFDTEEIVVKPVAPILRKDQKSTRLNSSH